MNTFEFYKYIYDRELNRRSKLDESINPIVGIISLLVAYLSYFFTNKEYSIIIECNIIIWTFITLIISCVAISIVFLVKSYNNYLRGFDYPNIAYLKLIRTFETQTLPEYNSKVSTSEKIEFENDLIDRLVRIADENTKINDTRAYSMYVAKTFVIIALTFLFLTTIIIITKNSQLC